LIERIAKLNLIV